MYREDINRVYSGALGTKPQGFGTRAVVRAFAETFGLAYAVGNAVAGYPETVSLHSKPVKTELKPPAERLSYYVAPKMFDYDFAPTNTYDYYSNYTYNKNRRVLRHT